MPTFDVLVTYYLYFYDITLKMADWDDKKSIFKREFWLEHRLNKFLIFPDKTRREKEERELEKKLRKIDKEDG